MAKSPLSSCPALGAFREDGLGPFIGMTDATGTYRIRALPIGLYYVATKNGAEFRDQVYPGVPCYATPCSLRDGDLVDVSLASTTAGIDFVLTRLGSIKGRVVIETTQAALSGIQVDVFGPSGAVPVFRYDRWWTVLSAGWLHAGVLHIGFNMMAVRDLLPPVVRLYGPSRAVIIYVLASVVGLAASSAAGAWLSFLPRVLSGGGFTVGASRRADSYHGM